MISALEYLPLLRHRAHHGLERRASIYVAESARFDFARHLGEAAPDRPEILEPLFPKEPAVEAAPRIGLSVVDEKGEVVMHRRKCGAGRGQDAVSPGGEPSGSCMVPGNSRESTTLTGAQHFREHEGVQVLFLTPVAVAAGWLLEPSGLRFGNGLPVPFGQHFAPCPAPCSVVKREGSLLDVRVIVLWNSVP